ncbi:PHD finger protein 20b isoform X2 [Tachysurus vachellii]|uniref:PHD finger protein 20b isoform X2 n=1 Tax=Tachysurus vachellii TaxID=175792 RepID=UPI00296AAD57|nr:PHD finger protein 20b isoform X2 [Tachysurus vachellii]
MTKTPPHRRGITFEVGAALEARDSLKNWYAASIEKIDYEDEKVLIHYRQWSHRYDEWFDWSSPYLRPVERIQLRRQGLQEHNMAPGFQINQKVLASWSDCRYYPAKILSRDKDDFYTVKFFDGVVKTVKGMKIKPFRKENTSNKPGQPSRKRTAGKNCKTKENGRNQQDGETESEEEDSKGTEKCGKLQDTLLAKTELPEMANGHQAAEEKPSNEELKTETQENGGGEVMEMDKGGDEENVGGTLHNGAHESCGEEQEKEEREKEAPLGQNRKTRGKVMEGKDTDRACVPELRKRRASTGQTPPSKRSRANTTDRNNRSQVRQTRSDSVPESFSDKDGLCKTGLLENPKPIAQTASSPDLATLLQRQVHLPTTNKYSREPLYRVIKNQPPPILSIELDHNPFKCQVPGCSKSFRKASLLHYHMKYYHSESELCSSHSTHTHTAEPQAQDSHTHPSETPRRRRTVSASLDTPSPLSDSKSSHTPSPHTANGVHRQRSSSHCERSKENQHTNRTLHDDRDWVTMETEREKRREKKQRDFCIKSKKKRKKKKRSKSDSHSSDKSNGFSSYPCNPNLSLKLPLSHKHRSYAAHFPEPELDDGEDSGSDWSTDSPLWSEEESETGLDLNTPFSEQGVETVGHDSEIVRCVCEVQEENDFMIQCDECLCWQHGTCMGLYEDSVPDTYSCYICRDPPAQRQSQRYWYDKDWLSSGHMYGLPFLEENYSHQNGKKMAATHQLLGDVHRVFEVLNGLQLKMSILQAQAHPDLKLWRQPWKPSDGILRKGAVHSGMTTPSPPSPRAADSIDAEQVNSKQPVPPACSFQTSYISSEHCYQKPHTYYPALEQRLVVETRSTEELLELETRKLQLTNAKELECRMKLLAAEREKSCAAQIKEEEPDPVTCDSKPDPDLLLHQQWQLNLLEHIEVVQDEVSHRMDLIERELDVLESWLDYTGELEPPEPLARLPQLKHRIRQLLTDLGTVQKIALCSSST